ncbi:MAG TPA: polysaccharide biosynthesis tyrosine autokinase [Thermoanaerobaculia bacterium]|nr:polysaccharide biosynthesis tyrosine autokinase [Thermoanaerobaculia bacterium]
MSPHRSRHPTVVDDADLFGGGEGDSSQDVAQYLRVLRRRWGMIAVVTVLALIAFGLRYSMTPKQYRATAQIQIERGGLANLAGDTNPLSAWVENYWNFEYYPTQYRLLQSRGVAEIVVDNLRLAENGEFNPAVESRDEAPTAAADRAALAGLAAKVLAGLQVQPITNTQLVEISYVSQDPRVARDIANGVVEAFIQWKTQTRSRTVQQASTFLQEQIDSLKEEIEEKDRRLREFGRSANIVTTEQGSNQTLERLTVLNQDYVQAVADRIDKEARYNELSSSPRETVADTLSGGLVGTLRSEQLRLEREYATNLNKFQPGWPAMVELESKIEKGREHLDGVIAETVDQALQGARAEYQTALRKERALLGELERLQAQDLAEGPATLSYSNLQIELATRRQLLDQLLGKQSETMVVSQLQTEDASNVRWVDTAVLPSGPFRPDLRRELTLGLLAGLVLGVGLVFSLEFLDRTIKSAEQVESLLRLPTLAVIPDVSSPSYGYGYGYGAGASRKGKGRVRRAFRRRTKGGDTDDLAIELLPYLRPRLAPSEAYRSLRTALLLSTADEMRSIVVTSTESGEGKTTTSTNLAVVMAQLGRRVLLVDADLRKPRLHEVFQVSNRVGLVNCLTAHVDLPDAFTPTSVPDLTLLTSGPTPPNPAELLASDRMHDLLEEMSKRFDFVVLDTPPVLAVTDSTVLGFLSGHVLLTVASGRTRREDARACLAKMKHSDAKVVGVVLNRFRPTGSRQSRYYAHYEAYGKAESGAEHSAA